MKSAVQIPRATCSLFGAIKALGTLRSCAILVHGPKGCVYHINYILGMRGDRPSCVYCTCLDERDVIFGAQGKLVAAIQELDESLHPEILAVLSCCASGIIGEDVSAAIREAQVSARVVGIDAGGFAGDFRQGYTVVLETLVRELVREPAETDPLSINLLGLLRTGPDLRILHSLIASIGVRVQAVLTAGATLAQIQDMGTAALNVVVCEPAGRSAAELLERRFGIPYIVREVPIGVTASHDLLTGIGEQLGISVRNELPTQPRPVALPFRRLAIASGPTRAIVLARFLREAGVEPALIIVDNASGLQEKIQGLASAGCRVLIDAGQDEITDSLRERNITLLIGGLLEKPIAQDLGIDFMDIMHGSEKTLGPDGTERLLQVLAGKQPSKK